MAQEALRSGFGFVNGSKRYGYTDGTLWYLGEIRLYLDYSIIKTGLNTAISYSELKNQVDSWIALSPVTRATYSTSDETQCSVGYNGIGIHSHEYYYQNYFFCGKADPQPYPRSTQLVQIFNYPPLGLSGVGMGIADGRLSIRGGYTDSKFWYKGECRLFRIAQLPSGATQIVNPPNGAPSASGVKYYQGTDGNTYLTDASGSAYTLLDFNFLKQLVDNWETASNQKTAISGDWISSGFLWLGQSYWQGVGKQCIADDFLVALNDPERYLNTIMIYLPGTKPINTNVNTGGVAVTVPSTIQSVQQGGNLGELASIAYLLNAQRSKKKRRKRR